MSNKIKEAVEEWIHAGELYNNLYKLGEITVHDTPQVAYVVYDKNNHKYFVGVA